MTDRGSENGNVGRCAFFLGFITADEDEMVRG